MNVTFKSALNPDKIGYRLSSDWDWNNKGNAPLSVYLQQFETYGDGMTQHSGAWAVQFADLTDACISLTQAIVADPLNEAWHQLSYMVHCSNPELLAFVQTIRYREDKAQWYNMTDRKISSSESKKHDKRWNHVESWMDGKAASCLSILLNGVPSCDWLSKLCWADDLREAMGYPLWEDMFKPTSEITGDWQQAFHAFRAAARAIASLDYAGRACASALYNTLPKPEAETVAA